MIGRFWSYLMAVVYMWKRRKTDQSDRHDNERPGWGVNIKEKREFIPQFKLVRKWFTPTTTIGDLYIDGVWKCFVLEDAVRHEKIKGKTAIPDGTYEIVLTYSNKFKKYLPLLHNVPNYKGIRMHPGNTHEDTEGCLLPGMEKAENNSAVFYSRKAFNDIHEVLKIMCAHEKIWIEIINEREVPPNEKRSIK